MSVVVDTPVWSLALRRRRPQASAVTTALADLIRAGQVQLLGVVRQELLFGVRERRDFEQLRAHLRAFPDLPLEAADYEDAATFFNQCRAKGVQGANTDFLICAAAARRDFAIFTTGDDFKAFARILPIRLHAVE